MIRDDLKSEIEYKLDVIRDNPRLYDERAKLVRDDLRNIGDIYSFWIENPDLRKQLALEKKKKESVKKMAKTGIRRIKDAWFFLTHHGLNRNFVDVLEPLHIIGANAIINHLHVNENAYRNKDVTLGFKGYTPPSPRAIPEMVQEIIRKVKLEYAERPIESAIYTHLALALVQPFEEANKRTARLIQDRILVDGGCPPAILPAGEAKFYFSLLEKTAASFRDGIEEGYGNFFNYIASKINNGLDRVLGDLKLSNSYLLDSIE